MKKFQFWKSVLVLFAAVGTVMPAPELLAADTRPVEVDSKEAVQKTLDVSLDADGVLNGYLVDGQGKGLGALGYEIFSSAAGDIPPRLWIPREAGPMSKEMGEGGSGKGGIFQAALLREHLT